MIVDVAHNPHGAAFLADQLRASGAVGRTYAVAGFLQDKDAAGIVAALEGQVDHWTFVDTYGSRGQTASLTAAKIPATTPRLASTRDFVTTLDALCESLAVGDRVVVLGSFDVAQRARTMLSSRVDDHA